MRRIQLLISSALALSLVTLAGVSSAEEGAAPAPAPAPAASRASSSAASEDGPSDHAKHVGHIGVGYFGAFTVPHDNTGANDTTHIVGIRYWFQEKMAIDAGLGWYMNSGSTKTTVGGTSTTVDQPSTLAFSLRAGLPISMYEGKHYSFIIEPQMIFGHSGTTIKVPNASDNSASGNHFAIGATAGAEVSFGFIGIPMLSLDATVGLALDWQSGSVKNGTSNDEASASGMTLATASFHQPWNIFTTSVAALYYF